jgi:hypothetical protein
MAKDIDLDSMSKSDADGIQLEGQISRQDRKPLKPVFDPMRRKNYIPNVGR